MDVKLRRLHSGGSAAILWVCGESLSMNEPTLRREKPRGLQRENSGFITFLEPPRLATEEDTPPLSFSFRQATKIPFCLNYFGLSLLPLATESHNLSKLLDVCNRIDRMLMEWSCDPMPLRQALLKGPFNHLQQCLCHSCNLSTISAIVGKVLWVRLVIADNWCES